MDGQTPRTVAGLFSRSCETYADRVMLIDGERTLIYRELQDRVNAFAAALVKAGIAPGDRVAHWMGNCLEWAVVKFGVELAGAVHVPLNTRYKTDDARFTLAHSGARALVLGAEAVGVDLAALLQNILPELAACEPGALSSAACPDLRTVVCLGRDVPGTLAFETFAAPDVDEETVAEVGRRREAMQADDPVNILYTSGTTGLPKGAVITHANVLANAAAGPRHINRTSDDRWLLALPLFHTFGCMMGLVYPLSIGASTVLLPRFDAELAMEAIQRHRCTVVEGVPTMFSDILEHPRRGEIDLSSWRKLYVGGSYSPEAFIRRLHDELGVDELITGFGMTEHAGMSCATNPGDPFELVSRTIGHPLDGALEFSIRDPESGDAVPDGVEAEICARGPSVFVGYHDDPRTTAATFHGGGWMRTGDLGEIDPSSGYFRITGRLKDIYIVGGENVSPAEVEDVLARHPDIVTANVCGVPDHRLGEVGVAFVKLRPGAELTGQDVMEHCRQRVANFKTPQHVVFVEDFPQTASGKIQRFVLRERAIEALGIGVNQASEVAT